MPNIHRCKQSDFVRLTRQIGIPYYFGEGTATSYCPKLGIRVGRYSNARGVTPLINASNYFHELAHVAVMVLRDKPNRLLKFDFNLHGITQVTRKNCLFALTHECVVVGVQSKLARFLGFSFDCDALYGAEASTFSNIKAHAARRQISLVDYLPVRLPRPKLLDVGDVDYETVFKLEQMYDKKLRKARISYLKALMYRHENTYSISEIFDALAKAELLLS